MLLVIFSFNASTVDRVPDHRLDDGLVPGRLEQPGDPRRALASLKVGDRHSGDRDAARRCSSPTRSPAGRCGSRQGVSALVLAAARRPDRRLRRRAARPLPPNDPVIPIPLGLWAVLIGHIVIALPFCVLLLLPRIASIDRRLEEAAHDLGASRPDDVPPDHPAADHAGVCSPSLIVAFVISIDEVVIASFLVQDQPTYPCTSTRAFASAAGRACSCRSRRVMLARQLPARVSRRSCPADRRAPGRAFAS